MAKHADDPGTLDLFPDELAAAFILEDDDEVSVAEKPAPPRVLRTVTMTFSDTNNFVTGLQALRIREYLGYLLQEFTRSLFQAARFCSSGLLVKV